MLKWQKIDQYAIKSSDERFHLSKNYCDGCTLYVLYDWDDLIGFNEDASELKNKAVELAKTPRIRPIKNR